LLELSFGAPVLHVCYICPSSKIIAIWCKLGNIFKLFMTAISKNSFTFFKHKDCVFYRPFAQKWSRRVIAPSLVPSYVNILSEITGSNNTKQECCL